MLYNISVYLWEEELVQFMEVTECNFTLYSLIRRDRVCEVRSEIFVFIVRDC